MIADFVDPQEGGFFFTANDHESLLARPKDPYDGALPGPNNVAVLNLMALHRATGEKRYLELAGKTLEAFSNPLAQNPAAMPVMLIGLLEYLDAKDATGQTASSTLVEDAKASTRAPVVTAKARLADGEHPVPGGVIKASVSLDIKPGWHVYANPTGVDFLKPTSLALAPGQPAGQAEARYPKGRSKVLGSLGKESVLLYEDKIEIPIAFTLFPSNKPGPLSVKLKLEYQACDDNVCLAPSRVFIPLELVIKEPGGAEAR
jgi:hypothetical protein